MDTRPYDLVGPGDNLLWLSSPRKRTNRTQPVGLGFSLKENPVGYRANGKRPLFCVSFPRAGTTPGPRRDHAMAAPGPRRPRAGTRRPGLAGRPPGTITKRPWPALP
ncbi:hypothetical protein Stube_45450 [Streptomyces tubercidicus]|uniref:Uncharacterized protein n=1 Tax=Streptomyces tubercidicus TaxID=47759 RepID=A0A640UWV8_9ACTN|nr:hypothetical protein Stube_45450 [Streptomyces tubercidicus]